MRLPSLTRVSLKKARWTGGGWGKRRETLISPFQAPRARPVGGLRHPDPRVPGSARLGGVTPRSFFFFKETLSFLVGVFKTHTKGERRRKKKMTTVQPNRLPKEEEEEKGKDEDPAKKLIRLVVQTLLREGGFQVCLTWWSIGKICPDACWNG